MGLAKPIRVAFCITELDPGGAERALTQLVLSLDRTEWDPHVICLGPRGTFADVLESANVPVICLNARGLLSLPRVFWRLRRELRRIKPALLQTFLFHANLVGRFAARLAGVPVVISGLRVAEHRSDWYGRIDRWTNSLVDMNVCVSRGVAEFSKRRVGLKSSKLIVIPNSVDVDRFANTKRADVSQFGIPANHRILISIGRLEHQKGIDVLLNAIALLKPLPDDVHFLIVGDGPDANTLRARAAELRIDNHVHFANRRDDVPDLLAASTALILPSRWEGMPNVVLEAMAAGRPVIASRVEGVEELVRHRETGLIVGPENPVELAAAISDLLGDSAFATAAGAESQRTALKEFATKKMSLAYTELYRRLLTVS